MRYIIDHHKLRVSFDVLASTLFRGETVYLLSEELQRVLPFVSVNRKLIPSFKIPLTEDEFHPVPTPHRMPELQTSAVAYGPPLIPIQSGEF